MNLKAHLSLPLALCRYDENTDGSSAVLILSLSHLLKSPPPPPQELQPWTTLLIYLGFLESGNSLIRSHFLSYSVVRSFSNLCSFPLFIPHITPQCDYIVKYCLKPLLKKYSPFKTKRLWDLTSIGHLK